MTYKKIFTSSVFRQYLAGGTCCLSMAIVGVLVSWTSSAIPKLKSHETNINLTSSELTWMTSSLHIGNFVSAIPGSYMMDKFGRKRTLIAAAVCPTVSWIILYFATEPYHMYIARFLGGLSLGCNYMITPVYISETSEPKVRGSIGNIMAVSLNSAVFYEYVIGPICSYNTLLFLSMLIPLLYILLFMCMPESPYYYVMKNRNDKAIESLIWLRYDKTEFEIVDELNTIDTSTKQQMEMKSAYKDLFVIKGYRKALIMAGLMAAFQRLTGVGPLMQFATVTLPEKSFTWLSLNQCILILSVTWFVSNLTSIPIVDRFKRKTLLSLSSFGCGLTTLIVSLWFYCDENNSLNTLTNITWLPFVMFLFHAEFYALGLGSIGNTIRGELFPANVKGKASSLIQMFSAVVSFVMAKLYLLIIDYYGMYLNYLIFGVSCMIAVLFITLYLIETKGKSLQKIQDELNNVYNKK